MSVGTQLRAARLERKLSLADVVTAIKIQPWVLEALETDRLQTQMSPIYVKGFLGSYARFLKLDTAQLLTEIVWPDASDQAAPTMSLAAQVQRANAKVVASAPAAQPPKLAGQVAPAPKPAVQAAPAPMRAEEPAPKPAPRPAPKRVVPAEAIPSAIEIPWPLLKRLGSLAVAAAAVAVVIVLRPAPAPHKAANVAKTSKAANVAKAAKTVAAPVAPNVRAASVTPVRDVPKPPALPTLTLLPTQPLELRVTAQRTTWIQIRADGKLVTQQRLQRGAQERWAAKKKLEVVVAKPSQIDLELNGQTISPFAIAHEGRLMITHYGVTKLPNEP